jgi:hypothetical protein
MIRGIYRDQVRDSHGQLTSDSGWLSNTIVDTAWPLFASLLKNQPRLSGIRFWAVGAGDSEWDYNRVATDPKASRLYKETQRLRISREQIIYLGEDGAEAPNPTSRIEIRADFGWPGQDQILREFGLFGGNASKVENSGYLINYVIHPRIDLKAGATLTRHLRLSFRPEIGPEWLETPQHWLGSSPVANLVGVGAAQVAALADAGIETIGQLADVEPLTTTVDLPLGQRVDMRAKARLTLRTAAGLSPISGLLDRSAWNIIVTPTATLAAEAGAAEGQVARLRDQVSALKSTLPNRFLQGVTIGELAQPL